MTHKYEGILLVVATLFSIGCIIIIHNIEKSVTTTIILKVTSCPTYPEFNPYSSFMGP